jgi:urease beta subunit
MRRGNAILVLVGLLSVAVVLWFSADGPPSSPTDSRQKVDGGMYERRLVRRGLRELRASSRGKSPKLETATAVRVVPQPVRRAALETLGGASELKLQFDHAHYLLATASGDAWLVDGRGVSCLLDRGGGSVVCDTAIAAARDGLLLETAAHGAKRHVPSQFRAVGVAPGWARSVRLKVGGGERELRLPRSHIYAIRARSPIDVLQMSRR